MSVGSTIIEESTLLANAIRQAPHARVRKYPSWDLAQLGRHVGEIHGWVTGIVRDGAAERPSRAKLTDVPDDEIPGVLHIGAAALAKVLDECDPSAPVWTFVAGGTNGFWCRRMVLETTIHRWDAEDAIGTPSPVPEQRALEGVDESVTTYAQAALADWELATAGSSVSARHGDGSCTISGVPLDMWLFLMGRRGLVGLEVDGDRQTAEHLANALAGLRGPDG